MPTQKKQLEEEKSVLPTVQIHGNPYVMVKDRVMEFHKRHPNGAIITQILKDDDLKIVTKAVVIPDITTQTRQFTGHATSYATGKGIEKQSPYEVSETSAVGRALAFLGIGVIESIASAEEVNYAVNRNPEIPVVEGQPLERPATDKQKNFLDKLAKEVKLTPEKKAKIREMLGITSADELTAAQASEYIEILLKEKAQKETGVAEVPIISNDELGEPGTDGKYDDGPIKENLPF